jgi:cytochrome b
VSGARVWDLPTRLFHWLLVVLLGFSWWSAEVREMEWHFWSGLTVLGLLAFRLIWGAVGGSTARFASFVRAPGAVLAWLRSKDQAKAPGHNPIGGYSVVLMLALLVVQASTGLFATDIDGLDSGPLSFLVEFDQGRTLARVHHLSFNLLLLVTIGHVLAILFYLLFRKRNLVSPMLTGRDPALDPAAGELQPASPIRLVTAVAAAGALIWAISNGFWL